MKKYILILFLFVASQWTYASGHFIYHVMGDSVYCGAYGLLELLPEADGKTFELIDPWESPWGLVPTYAKDKNHVFYFQTILENIDPITFSLVGKRYAKDKNYVLDIRRDHEVISELDASTFEMINEVFIKDKDVVYFNGHEKCVSIKGADAASFKILLGTKYLIDDYHVFYNDEKDFDILEDADPKTFVVDIPTSAYARDEKSVYWNGKKLRDSNPDSFKRIMNTGYSTDGSNIYFESEKLEDAEFASFYLEKRYLAVSKDHVYFKNVKLAELRPDNFTVLSDDYLKNDKVVYYCTQMIDSADAETFEVTMSWEARAKDKWRIYVKGKPEDKPHEYFGIYSNGVFYNRQSEIKGVDHSTFVALNDYYAKDKYSVYCTDKRLEKADPNTFELLDVLTGKDKLSVYAGSTKIVGANPRFFTMLNYRYGKDDKNAYFDHIKIQNAHLPTLSAQRFNYAKDQNNAYFEAQTIAGADAASFEAMPYPYSKDKNVVYYKTEVLKNADPYSFSILDWDYAKDTTTVFLRDKIVLEADPQSFMYIIGSNYWVDKNFVFTNGIKYENSHADSFQILDSYYAQDRNNVYYNGRINEAHSPTLRILGKGYAIDKDNVYLYGVKTKDDVTTFEMTKDYY